jgi:hypothetical protein
LEADVDTTWAEAKESVLAKALDHHLENTEVFGPAPSLEGLQTRTVRPKQKGHHTSFSAFHLHYELQGLRPTPVLRSELAPSSPLIIGT